MSCVSPDSPSVSTDALSNLKGCGFLSNVSENGLKGRMKTVLKKITSHPEMFKVSCEAKGNMKSFRFTENSKQKDPAYIVVVFDTAICGLVRIDNFCDFTENSELLRPMKD